MVSTANLIQLFKALIQSRVDYGLVVYGAAAPTNLKKIDVMIRQCLRTILGSVKSTPVEHLHAEAGITTTADRFKWLSRKYIIKISQEPLNPNRNLLKWKPERQPRLRRYTPAIAFGFALVKSDHPDLPTEVNMAMRQPLSQEIETIRFPMSKSEAKERHTECRMIFNEVISKHKKTDALQIYTDGSSDPQKEVATCAFWIPQLSKGQSWTLKRGSSIFTAERYAIYKSLQYVYSLDSCYEELLCISDSSSAVSTISQSITTKHPIVAEVSNLIACLTNSGTKSTLVWVPSHTGISIGPGRASTSNEKANNKLSIIWGTMDKK